MKRNTTRILFVVLGVSVILRVAVAFYLGNEIDAPPLLTDQRSYHALGERLITGHGFSFDRIWYPFTQANEPTAHWSFLYSIFVATVYAVFGPNPLAVRIVQAVIGGILLPLMVYRFARRLYQFSPLNPLASRLAERGLSAENIALCAAGLAAIYFYFVLYAATLMTETFYMTAVLWSLERSCAVAERPTLKGSMLLGISLSIAALLRQSILPWVVVLGIWLLWVGWRTGTFRRTLGTVGVAAGLLAFSIFPFTVRNYSVYGQFLLLNSNAGYAMYSAQHPLHGTDFQAFVGMPIPDELVGRNEAQLDQDLMQLGIRFILADPGRYLLLSSSRAVAYFEFWPTPDTTLLNNIGRVGSIGLFLPFMLYGLYLALRWMDWGGRHNWAAFSITPIALSLLFIGFYSVLHIMTWAMPRYRLPVDAVALSYAALALARIGQLIGERRRDRSGFNLADE